MQQQKILEKRLTRYSYLLLGINTVFQPWKGTDAEGEHTNFCKQFGYTNH